MIKALLKRILPRRARVWARYKIIQWQGALDHGHEVECNICGKEASRFAEFNSRPNAMCPRCFSLERHRLLYAWLGAETGLLKQPHRVLHFAPEKALAEKLRQAAGPQYVTADLMNQFIGLIEVRPDRVMSVTDIAFPPENFDVVICNHVLEHVPDDRRAMSEIHRVLAPGGRAILMVPIAANTDATDEDPLLPEAEKRRRFGSPDHVRMYGHGDFMHRLASIGFAVEPVRYASRLPARYRINDETIYVARKASRPV